MHIYGIRHLHHRPPTQLLINKLERVQHCATCWPWITEYKRMASVTERLVKLGWKTLEVRRPKIRLAMLYKILNHLIVIQTTQLIIKTNATRKENASAIFQLQVRPSYYHYSFYRWTIPLWRDTPKP